MSNKWYPAHEWIMEPKTRKLIEFISDNVEGRFTDAQVLDGPASSAAQRNIYRSGTTLLTRFRADCTGRQSHDVSSQRIDETKDPDGAAAARKRFPEAWEAYNDVVPLPTKKRKKA